MPQAEALESSGTAEKLRLTKRPGVVTIGRVQVAIPDLVVLDQDGKKRRFYSDLIKDKVVILTFFYTSCVTTCPIMGSTLTMLQSRLSGKLGKDVFLITVTRDPATDTPQKLKEWGIRYDVRRGWTMVTGQQENIAKIVKDFTGDSLGREEHSTIFLLGNDKTGDWTDALVDANSEDINRQIERLLSSPSQSGRYR